MSGLRYGEGERVPFLRDNWVLIVAKEKDDESQVRLYEFSCSDGGLKDLMTFMAGRGSDIMFAFCIWHGRHHTDLFVMEPAQVEKTARSTLERRAQRREELRQERKMRRA